MGHRYYEIRFFSGQIFLKTESWQKFNGNEKKDSQNNQPVNTFAA